MNMNEPTPKPDADEGAADLQGPEALVAALRRVASRPLKVPPARDEQVLALGRAELSARLSGGARRASRSADAPEPEVMPDEVGRPTRIIPFPRPWIRWAAAAGIALIGAVILFRGKPDATDAAIALEQPTILDAFALARKVEAGGMFDPKLDLNADGRVDQSDARLLAHRAVALPGGGAL